MGRPEGFRVVIADGRRLPFRDHSFDVVFCNSVIEHIVDREDRAALAAEIQRVGQSYFVQTPNYAFPIEPHFLAPGFQYFPRWIQHVLARNFTPMGWITRPSRAEARSLVDTILLLTANELARLFPGAQIYREKALGLTKSLVAYHNGRRSPTVVEAPRLT